MRRLSRTTAATAATCLPTLRCPPCCCLVSKSAPHADLLNGLEKLDIDEAVRKVLRRCMSLEVPVARPMNAINLNGPIRGSTESRLNPM